MDDTAQVQQLMLPFVPQQATPPTTEQAVEVHRTTVYRLAAPANRDSLCEALNWDYLEEKGFVTSEMGEPTPERGGRAKRYFHITAKGLRQVRETKEALTSLWKGLPELRGGEA